MKAYKRANYRYFALYQYPDFSTVPTRTDNPLDIYHDAKERFEDGALVLILDTVTMKHVTLDSHDGLVSWLNDIGEIPF